MGNELENLFNEVRDPNARKRAILTVSLELLTNLFSLPDDVRITAVSPEFTRDALQFRLEGKGLPGYCYCLPGEHAPEIMVNFRRNADGSISAEFNETTR